MDRNAETPSWNCPTGGGLIPQDRPLQDCGAQGIGNIIMVGLGELDGQSIRGEGTKVRGSVKSFLVIVLAF